MYRQTEYLRWSVAPSTIRHLEDSVQQQVVASVLVEHAAPVLKMETVCSSKMLVTMYQTTQCHKMRPKSIFPLL